MRQLLIATALALATAAASAAPVSIMIGDADGFGGAFPNLAVPQDQRIAAEAAASNGAQQTDFYSAMYAPLASSFTMVFDFGAPVASLSLDYRSFGLQATDFGLFTATANGFDVSALFNFQDGATTDATHSGAFSDAVINATNASNNKLTLTLARGGSIDAVAFDYFRITGNTNAVPEPTSLALSGLALVALGVASRRRAG